MTECLDDFCITSHNSGYHILMVNDFRGAIDNASAVFTMWPIAPVGSLVFEGNHCIIPFVGATEHIRTITCPAVSTSCIIILCIATERQCWTWQSSHTSARSIRFDCLRGHITAHALKDSVSQSVRVWHWRIWSPLLSSHPLFRSVLFSSIDSLHQLERVL